MLNQNTYTDLYHLAINEKKYCLYLSIYYKFNIIVIYQLINNFLEISFYFNENFNIKRDYLYLYNFSFFYKLDNLILNSYVNIDFNYNSNYTQTLTTFISQINDNLFITNNVENVKSSYHYSIPNTKLFYPEPFIASPSFLHSDL